MAGAHEVVPHARLLKPGDVVALQHGSDGAGILYRRVPAVGINHERDLVAQRLTRGRHCKRMVGWEWR